MTSKLSKPVDIPHWYLQIFQAVQHIDGSLREIEVELSDAMEAEALDVRIRAEMLRVLEALHAIKGGMVLVDMTARQALDDTIKRGGRAPGEERALHIGNPGGAEPRLATGTAGPRKRHMY